MNCIINCKNKITMLRRSIYFIVLLVTLRFYLTISILMSAFFLPDRVYKSQRFVKLMEYGCTSTKSEWTRKSSRVYGILTHIENLSIREEMDTKTRIYTRATKIDEVNIIADFRTPRNTRFMSLKSVCSCTYIVYGRIYPVMLSICDLFR